VTQTPSVCAGSKRMSEEGRLATARAAAQGRRWWSWSWWSWWSLSSWSGQTITSSSQEQPVGETDTLADVELPEPAARGQAITRDTLATLPPSTRHY